MARHVEIRNWFFWFAAAVSAGELAALTIALVIGVHASSRVPGAEPSHVILFVLVAFAFWLLGGIGSDGAYLVMEYVRGSTWRGALRRAGAFSPPVAAKRLDQLLEGVKAAHAAGVVHRDLKPENIMIGQNEQVKILDFGLAKLSRPLQDTGELTVAGALLGTLGYMSYEQLSGLEADQRSDIFALGVIASEAITGSRPFAGHTVPELANAMAKFECRLPSDTTLKTVLARCLSPEPSRRFATVTQRQQELIPALLASVPEENVMQGGDEGEATRTLGT